MLNLHNLKFQCAVADVAQHRKSVPTILSSSAPSPQTSLTLRHGRFS